MVSSRSKDLRNISVLGRASKNPLKVVITANLCVFYFYLLYHHETGIRQTIGKIVSRQEK